ncbi:MAG: bifunctional nuclease family protein [Planctomycetes bacterium]|nr:bifunctional nuclease family protein [Planctomycetota bacterium]MCH9727267.1 bifunctional nuclease family protein [Planctomycetota bacterium]MCH9776762.1 bifunctional nuclease family protein [Planctomycetota bacterium]MCH9789372.1 bifunctional nuclease family protein [Planctomycetota bacterium]
MLVEMELSRIIISELGDQQVIYLREVNGDRIFPILIGIFEATTIDRRVNQEQAPQRPLTHDLLKNTIEALGGNLQDIVITNLEDHTYYAVLRVDRDGQLIEIDSRPSDAIALSIHYDPIVPIFVHESVLEQTSK